MDEPTLIAKIVNSRTFRSSDQSRQLLQFLCDNSHRRILARDIEIDLWKHPEHSNVFDPGRVRVQIHTLKDFLERYCLESPDDDLICSISDGKDGHGYFPEFKKVKAGYIATSTLWGPHFVRGKNPSVVCDSLLFFYEHEQGRLLRYVDTNIEGKNRVEARRNLDARHKQHADENLLAGHFYVDVGAVLAADILREHFWEIWERRVPLIVEKEDAKHSWTDGSPVLLSTTRTNTYMKRILGSADAGMLAYRIHADRFAWATITSPNAEEKAALKKLKGRIRWEDGESFTTTVPELTLGIVTRMPNPVGGGGVVTFISSDATRNAKQLAIALTKEGQLRQIFDQMKWPYSRPIPERFELLFLVKLWPGDLDDEAGAPELLVGRVHGAEPSITA